MSCTRSEEQMFLHAHGELAGMARLAADLHRSRCATCRAQWARCTAERDSLRQALSPLPEPSMNMPSLADDVRARIRRLSPPEAGAARSPASVRKVAVLALAALLALALSAGAAYLAPEGSIFDRLPWNARPAVDVECGPDGLGPPVAPAPANAGKGGAAATTISSVAPVAATCEGETKPDSLTPKTPAPAPAVKPAAASDTADHCGPGETGAAPALPAEAKH